MKTSILNLLAGILLLSAASVTTLQAQGSITFEEPFHFVTDDGCGDFLVEGTVTVRFNGNGMILERYDGTATSLATGEQTPLHVRVADNSTPQGFTAILHGVFPGVMQFHFLFHINHRSDGPNSGINIVAKDFSHCIN